MVPLAVPIVEVEILNPLVNKNRVEEKMIVLDVLARDSMGRLFNIEVQTRLPQAFSNRLLFYNCKNYSQQLRTGEGYEKLRPAICVCLLNGRMFRESPQSLKQQWHHSFRLRCDQYPNFVLTDDLEFHLFELPKFRATAAQVSRLPPEQKWLYLFRYGAESDLETLSDLLPEKPFQEALGVLEMISKTPEDYQFYEDRLKYLRDEHGKVLAETQEAERREKLGEERGEKRGEKRGAILGLVAGKIQLCQSLLQEPVASSESLLAQPLEILNAQLAELKHRLQLP